ncbi:ester cyclase [Amycolatopsis acidicola]|uniref:Ester cyclase n=1 Tax=Amycolatopsis acidicola TaxID=2596893 RepID=A0A5N0VDC3_9PSEU|nr:ester cyclase [Amycolatopsis acidicola]KAA9162662.1 ester cyclase [Amycolatopsis acidicola]
MTPDERRESLRRFMDQAWNNGHTEACDELYAAHCSFHDPSFPVDGVAGMKQQIEQLRHAQPDLHMDIHDILVDGDLTAARWTLAGTARNEFRGLPATGKTYVMSGMSCDKWDGDRVVEEWVNYDLLGSLRQLGIIPETAVPQSTT